MNQKHVGEAIAEMTSRDSLINHDVTLGQIKDCWLHQLQVLDTLIQENILTTAFAYEAQSVKRAIDSFSLTVPLVGKFSAGKSTLLNAWLGQEIQNIDLEPCTDIATEFHFAQPNQQKMVVHLKNAAENIEQQEYPLTDYEQFKDGRLKVREKAQFVELHINLDALAEHPELVLVDTPGLGSNDKNHMQALANYLGDSVVFILCVTRSSQVGKEELAFVNRQRSLGQSVSLLVCQEDLNNASERENMRKTAAEQIGLDQEQLVRGCSARTGDLTGFNDILTHIEQQKVDLFKSRIKPHIEQLIQKAERMIQKQLAQDTTADELRESQKSITNGIERLQGIWGGEEQLLLQDCRGMVTRHVNADVSNFLRSRRRVYAEQLVSGQNISAILSADAQNALQLAVEQRLTPRLLDAAQKLGKEVQAGISGSVNLAMEVIPILLDKNIQNNAIQISSFVNQIAPIVLIKFPHPYVKIAAGAALLLANLLDAQSGEVDLRNQAEGKANEAIEHLISQLKEQTESLIVERGHSFLNELRLLVEEQLASEQQMITLLEKQIVVSDFERQSIVQKAQAALTTVRQLLQVPTE